MRLAEKILLFLTVSTMMLACSLSVYAFEDDAIIGSDYNTGTQLLDYYEVAFPDVYSNDWFAFYVKDVSERKIINGFPDGNFYPENKLTRAEAITMLYRAYAGSMGALPSNPFTDISNHWAKSYILWGYKNNIINGTGNGLYEPNAYITRQDFAVMIVRYCTNAEKFTLPTYSTKATFKDDSNISSYAKTSVYDLQEAGILSGNPNLKFYPLNYIKRSEASKIISMEIGLLSADGTVLVDETAGYIGGSLGLPTAFRVESSYYQEYRKTSSHITFFMAYSVISTDLVVTNLHNILLMAGHYSQDAHLYRNNKLIQERDLNLDRPSYTNANTGVNSRVHKVAYKYTTSGRYSSTCSNLITMSMPEGASGGKAFEHEVSTTF